MKDFAIVHTTCASKEDAHCIASDLVSENLVKCAQIHEIQSIYNWKGEICNDGEWRIELKCRAENYKKIEARILQIHASKLIEAPYETPEIIAIQIFETSNGYGEFLSD